MDIRKKIIILVGGFMITLAGALTPAGARSVGSDCVEPWLERCITTSANCIDCETYCEMNVGSECVPEYYKCEHDTEECTDPFRPVHEVCTCQDPFLR